MTVVKRHAFAPFAAEQMYDLVNDVEAYPDFLPWCVAADVLDRQPGALEARLQIRRGRFDYAFTTRNALEPGRAIELQLRDGPFRKLHGMWRFEPTDGGCLIRFHLYFEFRNRILGKAMAAAFRPIADSLVDAFKARAYTVYGV